MKSVAGWWHLSVSIQLLPPLVSEGGRFWRKKLSRCSRFGMGACRDDTPHAGSLCVDGL